MLTELGLTVSRQIPIEFLGGLLSGAYSLHGGVIRNGTGQIVAHLVSGGATSALTSLIPGVNVLSALGTNAQLYSLGRDVATIQSTLTDVLSIATTGAVLSGLGLVTSIVGFAFLHKRMVAMDKRLTVILDEVKDIKQTLSNQDLANLRSAVKLMQHAEHADTREVKHGKLLQANEAFTKLIYIYGQQWAGAKDVKQVPFLEDCYTLAFTGASLTNSELGMYEVASKEFEEHYQFWKTTAQRHVKSQLLAEDPQRLLKDTTAKILPIRQLIKIMDFAHDSKKGIDWIDELRTQPSLASQFLLPHLRTVPIRSIEMATNLTSRNDVLQATAAHLGFLDSRRMSVSKFSKAIEDERKRLDDAPAVFVSLAAA